MSISKLPAILISLAFLLIGPSQAEEQHEHNSHNSKNRFGSHGMALLTDGTHWYASHMPLYRRPHDVQLIYKIELEEAQRKALQSNNVGLISLLPDNFDLNLLIAGKPLEINADVFRGHFERDGKLWMDDIKVKFAEPVYLRHLDDEQLQDVTASVVYDRVQLSGEYLLLVRQITKAPSVDSLLLVSVNGNKTAESCASPDEMLLSGLPINHEKRLVKEAVHNLISGCFNIKDSYWETADFKK